MPDVFSDFVRQRRQELGQTQRQVAQACCVTPEMITLIEAGRRRPDPAWPPRLADALETDRAAFCRLALATWHPLFYSELVGEAIPTGDLSAEDPQNRVTVELHREDAAWVRSLQRLDLATRHHLRQIAEQLANPPSPR